MALNGYVLNTDVTFTWDGVSQRIMRGTVIDTPAAAGSNLAQTLVTASAGCLTALTTNQQAAMNGNSLGQGTLENLAGSYGPGSEPYHYQN